MENTSCLQGNRTTSEISTNKNSPDVWLRPLCSLDLVALSARLSHSKFPHEHKVHVRAQRTTSSAADGRRRRGKKKNIMKKFNNCVELSVFIIPPLLLDRDDLLVTNCMDLNRGPFGEPFHHLNSMGSNSHDLMRCRMPEICCLCFLFSPSSLSHQQQP